VASFSGFNEGLKRNGNLLIGFVEVCEKQAIKVEIEIAWQVAKYRSQ